MQPPDALYHQASLKTANDLRTIAAAVNIRELSHLTLPEIERLSDEVARVVPAGNVPGLVLSGLSRINGRQVEKTEAVKHIGLLFKGVRQTVDRVVYNAFFAGPAAVLYGYQQLLKLAAKDQDAAFPDGTWQFYLEFALREDSARYANETVGFHNAIAQYNLHLTESDQLAAWLLTAAFMLRQLSDILANEWYEPVALKILWDIASEPESPNVEGLQNLQTQWEKARPYKRGADAGHDDYSAYRRRIFDGFLKPHLDTLSASARQAYFERLSQAFSDRLPAYQRQMSWLAYLEPDTYNEARTPYALADASIAVIWQGVYYLIPVEKLFDTQFAREAGAAIMRGAGSQSQATLDELLVTSGRSHQPSLRKLLDPKTREEVEHLRRAPIIINWDQRQAREPLAEIRKGKRGIGDHALTILRTEESIVFDQSHIFFDGGWGGAAAEIMTNEAISWAVYLSQLSSAVSTAQTPTRLSLQASQQLITQAHEAAITAEVGVENTGIKLGAILGLRKLLKQRSDLMTITVNDLLVLYRSLHAIRYQPSPALTRTLEALAADSNPEAQRAANLIHREFARLSTTNPSILIPIDARPYDPRERLFPTTFRNPLTNLYDYHLRTLDTMRAYKSQASGTRSEEFSAFYDAQLTYLRLLAGFGELLSRYRRIALEGQSTSTASIRVLGHLPPALQKLLDTIPSRFDVLNEIIKGEEVFSNMGRVAKGSTLRRFITAKDDNVQKTLAWGVITDDRDTMHLTLRDFRPHVAVLYQIGKADLARQIAQDYVDAFADGLNKYIVELRDITITSRETRMVKE